MGPREWKRTNSQVIKCKSAELTVPGRVSPKALTSAFVKPRAGQKRLLQGADGQAGQGGPAALVQCLTLQGKSASGQGHTAFHRQHAFMSEDQASSHKAGTGEPGTPHPGRKRWPVPAGISSRMGGRATSLCGQRRSSQVASRTQSSTRHRATKPRPQEDAPGRSGDPATAKLLKQADGTRPLV